MTALKRLLLTAVLASLGSGCGGDEGKGTGRDPNLPPADKLFDKKATDAKDGKPGPKAG